MAKYTIVGVEHITGTSRKNGRPYDMDILHVICEMPPRGREMVGKQVDKITISRDTGILIYPPAPGQVYEIGFNRSGYVDYAELCE